MPFGTLLLQVRSRTRSSSTTCELAGFSESQAFPNLPNQNLHFNKNLRWSIGTLNFEKHHFTSYISKKKKRRVSLVLKLQRSSLLGIPKSGSPVVRTLKLPQLGAWVQSLVRELRSCKLCGTARKKKRKKGGKKGSLFCLVEIHLWPRRVYPGFVNIGTYEQGALGT